MTTFGGPDDRHRVLTYLLLPPVMLAGGVASGMARAGWHDHLVATGLSGTPLYRLLGQASAAFGPMELAAGLVGGLLGFAVGPIPVLLLGLGLLSVGSGAVALLDGSATVAPMAVCRLGGDLVLLGAWASAALPLRGSREPQRIGLFILLWGVMNGGFLLTGGLSRALTALVGPQGVLFAASGLAGLGALAAAPLLVTWLRSRASVPRREDPSLTVEAWVPLGAERAPSSVDRTDPRVHAHLVAGALVLVSFVPWASHSYGYELLVEAAGRGAGLMGVNQLAVVGFGLLLPIVFWLQARRGVWAPAMVLAGIGLMLSAPAAVGLAWAPLRGSMGGLTSVLLLMTVAEILIGPVLLSRVAGDVHWRFVCLLVGAWLGADSLVPFRTVVEVTDQTLLEGHPHLLHVLAQVLGAIVGLGLVIAAAPIQRLVYGRIEVSTPDGS